MVFTHKSILKNCARMIEDRWTLSKVRRAVSWKNYEIYDEFEKSCPETCTSVNLVGLLLHFHVLSPESRYQ